MKLSNEQKQQVNIAVAKDMGIYLKPLQGIQCDDPCAVVTSSTGNSFNIFNPDNTTDLNKAVEFYKLSTEWRWGAKFWDCKNGSNPSRMIWERHESRDESMRMAVVKASGVKGGGESDE